jgi:hypothetical protein
MSMLYSTAYEHTWLFYINYRLDMKIKTLCKFPGGSSHGVCHNIITACALLLHHQSIDLLTFSHQNELSWKSCAVSMAFSQCIITNSLYTVDWLLKLLHCSKESTSQHTSKWWLRWCCCHH